jgi:low temperature requirement protein LtrA
MVDLRRGFRTWWKPPRALRDRQPDRSVTFLELFYDLVYVVLVAELAHSLATDVTLSGVTSFAFLFTIVWWAWFNGSSYHDLHGNDDVRTRIFTFLQMFTVAAMAVFAHNALGDGSVGFALSYAAFQLILTYLWWRTGVHDPYHRPLSQPYVIAFLITTLLFVVSTLVPPPFRFYLWGLALVISLLLPLNTFRQSRSTPDVVEQIERAINVSPALVERFGLFTIIVLGEVVAGTIRGVAGTEQLTWLVGATAALGMLIAIGIWWIYFGLLAHHLPISTASKVSQWFYLHLPLTAGIAAAGAAVLSIIEHTSEPKDAAANWLVIGSVALVLVCVALLTQTIRLPDEQIEYYRRGSRLTLVSSLAILLVGILSPPTITLLLLIVILILIPIVYAVVIWVRRFGGAEEHPVY